MQACRRPNHEVADKRVQGGVSHAVVCADGANRRSSFQIRQRAEQFQGWRDQLVLSSAVRLEMGRLEHDTGPPWAPVVLTIFKSPLWYEGMSPFGSALRPTYDPLHTCRHSSLRQINAAGIRRGPMSGGAGGTTGVPGGGARSRARASRVHTAFAARRRASSLPTMKWPPPKRGVRKRAHHPEIKANQGSPFLLAPGPGRRVLGRNSLPPDIRVYWQKRYGYILCL